MGKTPKRATRRRPKQKPTRKVAEIHDELCGVVDKFEAGLRERAKDFMATLEKDSERMLEEFRGAYRSKLFSFTATQLSRLDSNAQKLQDLLISRDGLASSIDKAFLRLNNLEGQIGTLEGMLNRRASEIRDKIDELITSTVEATEDDE